MHARPLALAGLIAAAFAVAASPAAAGTLLDRARQALEETGDKIEKAADDAGREVRNFLVDNPDLNRDLVDLGKRLKLPGFDDAGPDAGAGLVAAPSPTAQGGSITLGAVGLPGSTDVSIAAGPSVGAAEEIATATTSDRGTLQVTVTVPEDAAPDMPLVFVVETDDKRVRVVSEAIPVVAAADIVRISGTLSKEGVECPALRGDDGMLYTLAIDSLGDFEPGDRVEVEGTPAEISICTQGTTLGVISMVALK
ncbi:DUF5818 domain-containing protein [Bauldia litoralis]|uniref:DUF5818 domain-containing protein n=1 Tax=Bauldia litoralis TaxID=665467 RepID=UPI003298235E